MIKKTRNCIVCGTEYKYCNNCKSDASLPTWMAIYHDGNCRNIMNIATEYMAGNITKESAKAELEKCDLSSKKDFTESVLRAVNEIYSVKKAAKPESTKATEEVVEKSEKV